MSGGSGERVRRGRPPTGSLLTWADDVFPAIADRIERELPVSEAEIAADCSTNRRTLGEVVLRDTGFRWAQAISRISRPAYEPDLDDSAMKRVTVTLDDQTFVALRRQALDEFRDPRIVARLILERGLNARRARDPRPLRAGSDAA
jgi:hypothetical protein